MGVKLLPIVVYTHTDMKDVWVPFFGQLKRYMACLLYTSPSPRDYAASRMPSSA